VLITAAVAADVPPALSGRRFTVQNATVTMEAEPTVAEPDEASGDREEAASE
jgi:hypothetical protein